METSQASYDDASPRATARAYPRWARWSVALLGVAAALGAALIATATLVANDPPITPPVLLRAFGIYVGLPAVAACALAGAFAASVTVRSGELIVEQAGRRTEIPLSAIARVRAWSLPLPSPGVELERGSGLPLGFALALRDPTPLLGALDRAGVVGAREPLGGALARWSAARRATAPPTLVRRLLDFPVFALLPTALLFNVHQQISYGGLLGEYHLLGAGAWLGTLATYWATCTVYLVLWASAWRGLAELACYWIARAAPARSEQARRAAERMCGIAYYAGVPLLLALRLLP